MPVYSMQQAETKTYTEAELEEQKRQIEKEVDGSGNPDKASCNRLKKFFYEIGIFHISEMDYLLRQRYETYLRDSGYTKATINKSMNTYDHVKCYDIDQQMKTLAGKQRYQWKYQNKALFLPYHPEKAIADEFRITRQKEILVWDFKAKCSEIMKRQIFDTLNYVIETFGDQMARRKKLQALKEFYLFCIRERIADVEQLELEHIDRFQTHLEQQGTQALRYSSIVNICRKQAFVRADKIHWHAGVWYLERLHIGKDRLDESKSLESISFLEIKEKKHREIAQAYMKYELGVTGQAISTIKRRYMVVRNFLGYLEKNGIMVTDCTAFHMEEYVKILQARNIDHKGFNERLSGLGHFFRFMEVRKCISKVTFRMEYYMQKVVNVHHDRSVEYEAYMEILQKLHQFPEHLRCMFLHLWCLGLRASEVCVLKGDAYYRQGKDCWIQVYQVKMKSYKRIPIPAGLYKIMQIYLKRHQIQLGDYIFKSHDYRHTVATMFYDNAVSIQSIRDYLGHTYEEMTRQYIDYMPRRIAEANEAYFSHPDHSPAACLKKGEPDGR